MNTRNRKDPCVHAVTQERILNCYINY